MQSSLKSMGLRTTTTKTTSTRRGRISSNRKPRAANGPKPERLQRNEVIEQGMPGFKALRYKAKLTYYDIITVTSAAGVNGAYIYSANGLYDPDITSTGHQPMTFDQLMLSFEHYCVVRAKMTVSFRNTSTTNSAGVAISLNAGPTATTNTTQLIENGNLVRDRLALSPSDDSIKTLSIPIDIAKYGSVSDLLDNPDYNGSLSANPVEASYFQISAWNPDSVTAVAVNCEVYIEYEAWFFEPRKNSVSMSAHLRKFLLSEEKNNSTR